MEYHSSTEFYVLGCTARKSNMILLTFWHCWREMQNGQLSKYFQCFVWQEQSTSRVLSGCVPSRREEWRGEEKTRRKERRSQQSRAERWKPYLKKHWGSWLENFSLFGWGCHFSHPACVLLLPPSGQHREIRGGRRKRVWVLFVNLP